MGDDGGKYVAGKIKAVMVQEAIEYLPLKQKGQQIRKGQREADHIEITAIRSLEKIHFDTSRSISLAAFIAGVLFASATVVSVKQSLAFFIF